MIGAGCVAFQVYLFTAGFLRNFTPTPTGPTPIPGLMKFGIVAQEAIGIVLWLAVLYWVIARPWRREHRLTFDGLMILCFMFATYWQDLLSNYTQISNMYNSGFINFGSWYSNVPGWLAPGGHLMPEPIIWAMPAYCYAIFGGIVLSNAFMRRVKARWPQLGTVGMMATCWAFFLFVDLLIELTWLRLGTYAYQGTVGSLTIFKGHYYQLPLYEVVLWGTAWAALACVRYFRDDNGRSVAERGIDTVRATPKQKTWLRFFALAGVMNVIFLAYMVPFNWFSLQQDAWPKDITSRSYFTNGICGPRTEYACPGRHVPINRPDSVHVTPDGSLAR